MGRKYRLRRYDGGAPGGQASREHRAALASDDGIINSQRVSEILADLPDMVLALTLTAKRFAHRMA